MQGLYLAELAHVVNILAPVDVNGGANSDVFSLENYGHATIIVQVGVSAATPTFKVQECDDFVPTNTTDIGFRIYKEETANGDTLGAKTDVAATGQAISGNNGIFYVIEVDARELTDGYGKLRLNISDGAASVIMSAVAILSGSRYAGAEKATAIA